MEASKVEILEKKIAGFSIVPVVVLDEVSDALPLAEALCGGGLPCAEVTFRTKAAREAIEKIAASHPEMLVGAGTVLSVEQVRQAVDAGAAFIVCPGFDAEIVDYCIEKNIPVFPGCVTPSDLMQLAKRGLKTAKFFPAEQFGGLATIKALAAPFVGMKFMPTGGIGEKNLKEYLSSDIVLACGGSWMVKGDLIRSGEFDKIRELTREAVSLAREVRP